MSGRFGDRALFERALDLALEYRDSLDERKPAARMSAPDLREAFDVPLVDEGVDPQTVLEELYATAEPGLAGSAGPRWMGFVTGGSLPVAVAADWLTSAWDQNAGLVVLSPAAAAVEEVVKGWILELLDLPREASIGLVSGGQMANVTAIAAARHALLAKHGHDAERHGLFGAPPIDVIVGEHAHATIYGALRLLGIGTDNHHTIPADDQGRMRTDHLAETLTQNPGPTLICALAGDVCTGDFDHFDEIADLADNHGDCWTHVDGAFGLWARATLTHRHLTAGVERADSWTIDAHKWLNVPYDSGIVAIRDKTAHTAAMMLRAPYLTHSSPSSAGNPTDYVPEASRRARGFVIYATLRALGRQGITDVVQRCCRHAQTIRDALADEPGIEVLNDVVLNQVLVRFSAPTPEQADARTEAIIKRIQDDGTCWVAGTTWKNHAAMRISIVNWSIADHDVQASIDAIATAARAVPAD